ncbi:MAG: hypothetical protein LBQ79_06975 [Deltaproteobacteria bacterium]|jgi:hypothetical protein|nr:hypothetical protein [Deltaproteobacteria bacterium]
MPGTFRASGGGGGALGGVIAAAVILPLLWSLAEPRVSAAVIRLGDGALAPLDFLEDVRAFRGRIRDAADRAAAEGVRAAEGPFAAETCAAADPYGVEYCAEADPYGAETWAEADPYGAETCAVADTCGAWDPGRPGGRGAGGDGRGAREEPAGPGAAEVMGFAGRYYRFLFVPLAVAMCLMILKRDPGRVYRRELDMWSLLENNAKEFPCLKPILRTGPITLKPPCEGGWALARSPIIMCAELGLLLGPGGAPYGAGELVDPETGLGLRDSPALGRAVNGLDGLRACRVLAGQLGDLFMGKPGDLPPGKASLAAALLCHADDRKSRCYRILDALSERWVPGRPAADVPGAREECERYAEARHPLLDMHRSYVNVWFSALLKLARKRGALPSSLWIWLKPTDRTLFYSLSQVGGRAAWPEASGVWSHYAAESRAGRTLRGPVVDGAAAAFAAALRKDGWIAPEDGAAVGPYGHFYVGESVEPNAELMGAAAGFARAESADAEADRNAVGMGGIVRAGEDGKTPETWRGEDILEGIREMQRKELFDAVKKGTHPEPWRSWALGESGGAEGGGAGAEPDAERHGDGAEDEADWDRHGDGAGAEADGNEEGGGVHDVRGIDDVEDDGEGGDGDGDDEGGEDGLEEGEAGENFSGEDFGFDEGKGEGECTGGGRDEEDY